MHITRYSHVALREDEGERERERERGRPLSPSDISHEAEMHRLSRQTRDGGSAAVHRFKRRVVRFSHFTLEKDKI